MSGTDIAGIVIGLIILLFVLAVGGLLVSALAIPPKDNRFEEQERQAALDQERERVATREAEQQMRYLSEWARERGHQQAGPAPYDWDDRHGGGQHD